MLITYPGPGHIVLHGISFLAEPDEEDCRAFVSALFAVRAVRSVAIAPLGRRAEIRLDSREDVRAFGEELTRGGAAVDLSALPPLKRDLTGCIRLHRHGRIVSTWRVVSDIPGRIRLRNDVLFRRRRLCDAVERELIKVAGIDRFRASAVAASVLIHYDAGRLSGEDVLAALDRILGEAEEPPSGDAHNYEMVVCTGTVALSAAAQFAVRLLSLPTALLLVYCTWPTFINACRTAFAERRLSVDVLDAIVIVVCLLTSELFAVAILAWCLALGRRLLERAREDSRQKLVSVFAKESHTAWLVVDGVEVNVRIERLAAGDVVAVHTGELIPVDGLVVDGDAVVDQQSLTGESVPLEKSPGSTVFASTLVVGGRLFVAVQRAGKETAAARITAILNQTASCPLASQSRGERLADRAVLPTLALAGAGYASAGLRAAAAIVNCDFGTGIRMAAPLALLRTLTGCAGRGILVKDGRALEEMAHVDTVLFDKTGTLTRAMPRVAAIHTFGEWLRHDVLRYAAAAERRLDHPIARAIVAEYTKLALPFPPTDRSSYEVGYGIRVHVERRQVRVGSSRYLRQSAVTVPDAVDAAEERAHDAGHSVVHVAVDGAVAGTIELAPALRDGVAELVQWLRLDGVREIVVISGDHAAPTRALAESLGADRWFAEVLPDQKARYVELLQSEGRRVCFVGDGINDAIALNRANVSVSLRGAAAIATDAAQVVLLDEDLGRLREFLALARGLERNVSTSWKIIIVPNVACVAGALFFGFGVLASVVANNIGAVAAVANAFRAKSPAS
jgi:heavy metal translocating P-type ATPase